MIRHYKLFLFSGFIIFILPFLGIPQVWKSIFLFIIGGILIIISLSYRHILRAQNSNEDDVYVDSIQESKKEFYENDTEITRSFPSTQNAEESEDNFSEVDEEEIGAEIEVLEMIDGDAEIDDLEEFDLVDGEVEEEVIKVTSKEDILSYFGEGEQELNQLVSHDEELIVDKKKNPKKKEITEEKAKRKRGRPKKIKE